LRVSSGRATNTHPPGDEGISCHESFLQQPLFCLPSPPRRSLSFSFGSFHGRFIRRFFVLLLAESVPAPFRILKIVGFSSSSSVLVAKDPVSLPRVGSLFLSTQVRLHSVLGPAEYTSSAWTVTTSTAFATCSFISVFPPTLIV